MNYFDFIFQIWGGMLQTGLALVYRIFILAIVFCIIREIYYYFKHFRHYRKSDYYINTHCKYWKLRFDKGLFGEYLIYYKLKNLDGYKRFLFNCYVPKQSGDYTEIDVLLLHESGIYVLESKNYSGWIFGTETQNTWTQVLYRKKRTFFNPIIQNQVHLKWLKLYLNDYDDGVFNSYIVFSERCTLKKIILTSDRHRVVQRNNLFKMISNEVKQKGSLLTKLEIDKLYEKLYPLSQMDEETKSLHVKKLKQEDSQVKVTKQSKHGQAESLYCPWCGGNLILRVAKKGNHVGNQFYGCSNFPRCKYIRNISE